MPTTLFDLNFLGMAGLHCSRKQQSNILDDVCINVKEAGTVET
jgi:hypothetical protein